MTEFTEDFDPMKELEEANARLPIDISHAAIPLEMQMRTIALTLAQRHCGDTVVREGNLYQHLKMDGKLVGPLTVDHVIHAARIFELFLLGKWSEGIVQTAMEKVAQEAADGLADRLDDGMDALP